MADGHEVGGRRARRDRGEKRGSRRGPISGIDNIVEAIKIDRDDLGP